MYDAVIVGASFAGLAVANQLRDRRVLLLDRKPVGSGQTSACGTILRVLQHWGLTEAVLQVHHNLVLHTAWGSIDFRSPYPWCTFDYRLLCEILLERSGAEFAQVTVRGHDGEQVVTDRAGFRGRCLVDASGWRSVLARPTRATPRATTMGFGLESICALPDTTGLDPSALHFWYDRSVIKDGVGWVFPRGDTAAIGVASYHGSSGLRRPLERFVARLGLQAGAVHGNRIPHALCAPTAGQVFVVGDAAGMCLGLTGEGIRPALFFGETCGQLLRQVLGGRLTLESGLAEYRAFVAAHRRPFDVFSLAQSVLTRLPRPWIDWIAYRVQHERLRQQVFAWYWDLTRAWDAYQHALLSMPT